MIVPPPDEEPWPTLGAGVCEWIESSLVFGPGDLRGQPYVLNPEQKALVYRMYEVCPEGHERAGKRRFNRVGISLRKGLAKTEFAAAIAAAELHPDAPVRLSGWRTVKGKREPQGQGVTDPYIPMVADTKAQTEELAYYALYVMIGESPQIARDFDVGLARVMRRGGDGKAVALAAAPNARDGARTTFQHFDETHRHTMPRLRQAHRTMNANLMKRPYADPWSLETTTAPSPGTGSVAEATMDYARLILAGEKQDQRLFFFHREAGPQHDISTRKGLRAAIIDASGPSGSAWSDIEGIASQWDDPTADFSYLERVWLNRLVNVADTAFAADKFRALARPGQQIPAKSLVTLGFDGSRYNDETALVATEVATGHQVVAGRWWNEKAAAEWEVPAAEVDGAVAEAFERWEVWRMYADPYFWESHLAKWAGLYGEKRVVEFRTTRLRLMTDALQAYARAIEHEELTFDGSEAFWRHVGNARKRFTNYTSEDGQKLWLIQKERPDSPFKIDLAMAGCLSWQARLDAVAAGPVQTKQGPNLAGLE